VLGPTCLGVSAEKMPSGAHSTGTCLYLLYASPLNAFRASGAYN
jgi:hypothetical protein